MSGEGLRYLLSRELRGFQNRLGRFGKEKNLLRLPGFEPQLSSLLPSCYTDYIAAHQLSF